MWTFGRVLVTWIAISSLTVEFCLGGTAEESAIITYLYKKCSVEQANRVKVAVEEFTMNMDLKFSYITQNPEHFCKNEAKILQLGVAHVMDEFSHCLAPDEKFLKKFAVKSFSGFLEFICYKESENINLIFSTDGQSCMNNLKNNETNTAVENCFSKILGPSQNHVKKDELCRDLKQAEICFADLITRRCPTSTSFPVLVRRLFNDLEKPCREDASTTLLNDLEGTLEESAMVTYLYKKCSVEQADRVKTALDEFTLNLDLKLSDVAQKPEHFCKNEAKILQAGAAHVMDEFGHCLPSDEKFLKKFAVESFSGFLEFICFMGNDNINKIFSTDGQHCMSNLKKNETSAAARECFSKIMGPSQNHVKKEELCRDLKQAETCSADLVTLRCPTSTNFPILVRRLFDSLQKPCRSNAPTTLLNGTGTGTGTLIIGLLAVVILGKESILGI